MSIQMVKLLGRELVAKGTMTFHFEKPDGFWYKAGQFADFTLIDSPETDAEGNIRGFSLASAPYEKDLTIATRLRDIAFKRVLRELPDGTSLKLDAPYGSFTLHPLAEADVCRSRAKSALVSDSDARFCARYCRASSVSDQCDHDCTWQ
jgi:ferredoxin-NADP reductase